PLQQPAGLVTNGRRRPLYADADRSRRSAAAVWPGAAARAGGQRSVLADQQVEMVALLVGELEEDALAFGLLEPLAVPLEEAVRTALAADADQQRALVVDALPQLFGTGGKQAVGRALEEQECRLRLETGIGRDQLLIPRFELAQMLFLFGAELLEDAS